MELHESEKAWMKVVAKAWSDQAFKAQLLADPSAVLRENGIIPPNGITFKVLEDSATTVHLILQNRPEELSNEQLDKVAAGALSLSYDSGAGNGPFGLGWSISVPAVTLKTDKSIPTY
jgi:hypothetical protein